LFQGASFNIEKQRAFPGKQVPPRWDSIIMPDGSMFPSIPSPTASIPAMSAITTAFHLKDPLDALFSTVHESGHGIYEQGLLPEYRGTPLAAQAA